MHLHSPNDTDGTTQTVVSEQRSRNMAAVRRSDTKPELQVRSMLHRRGFRYRKDYPVRVDGRLARPDIAFTRSKVAVFIDGCFWHRCPQHGQIPVTNRAFWQNKLDRNAARDREQTSALEAAGWTVLRIWGHVRTEDAVATIVQTIERRT